ncbi:MAG: glycosyltransferase, partial [Patescibacteria group bacterium]
KLEKQIRNLNVQNEFSLLPYQEDGGRFLPAFDVVVSSSVKEGLPYALIEAALAGRPVVAADTGGCGEIVKDGETGILVPAKNPEKLAEAIEALIGDEKLRKRMGEDARRRAEKEFAIERMIGETERVFENLATDGF